MSGPHVVCTKEASISAIETKVDGIQKSVERIEYAIVGNGQPGLKTIVAKHDQLLTGIMWVVGVIGTGVASIAVALISQYLGGFHK